MAWLCALALATLSCSSDHPPEPTAASRRARDPKPPPPEAKSAASPAGPTAGECSTESLHEELVGYCDAAAQSGPPGMTTLPWTVSPNERPADAVEITMTSPGRVHVDGSPTPLGELAARWRSKSEARRRRRATPSGRTPWSVGAAPDTPVSDVAAVLSALAGAGDHEGFFVFSVRGADVGSGPRDPKRLAALHAKVHSPDMSQKATMLATAIQRSSLTRCAPLVKVFSAMATVAPAQKCAMLARGAAEGFPKCQCQNADEIMTLLYAVMADTQPPKRRGAWIPVVLSESAPPVTAKEGVLWSGFVSQLDPAALAAFRIAVE